MGFVEHQLWRKKDVKLGKVVTPTKTLWELLHGRSRKGIDLEQVFTLTFSSVFAIKEMLACSSSELLLFSLFESFQVTIKLLFFLSLKYFFFFNWGQTTFICLGFWHSKQMILLLSFLYYFLNLVSFLLEECWNFPFISRLL